MPSFEAAPQIAPSNEQQRPQSRKDSIEPGTESMLWHMMNDMHRAIDNNNNSALHDEKQGKKSSLMDVH